MPNVLITGCDRGLGAELARQYALDGWKVFATTLGKPQDSPVNGFPGDLVVHQLDVRRPDHFTALQSTVGEMPIDLLLSNAALGIRALGGHNPKPGAFDYDIWQRMIETNLFGPMRLVEAFTSNVAASELRTIAFVSSRMGSTTFNRVGGGYAYRSSKAALNAAARSLSIDLLPQRITVLVLHPGNAKTFPQTGTIEVADSIAGMRRVIRHANLEDTGSFYAWDGTLLPW